MYFKLLTGFLKLMFTYLLSQTPANSKVFYYISLLLGVRLFNTGTLKGWPPCGGSVASVSITP